MKSFIFALQSLQRICYQQARTSPPFISLIRNRAHNSCKYNIDWLENVKGKTKIAYAVQHRLSSVPDIRAKQALNPERKKLTVP